MGHVARCAAAAAALVVLALAAPAAPAAAVEPAGYQANDGKGFRDVLPSGTRGRYNLVELGAFIAAGQTVPHCCEQLAMYGDLVYATPGLKAEDLPKYYKDSSFGVKPGDEERTYSPREDVTIVRDKGFGVPHIYGRDRDGAMFGLGYAGAEDRLFFMDVLRNAGRGQLSSFAGGANVAMDQDVWSSSPYTETDLERQVDQLDDLFGPDGATVQRDVENYVAGVNAYIDAAKANPSLMPGEYAAIARPGGPTPWKPADVIATAALVGGIFGKGGGLELEFARIRKALQARLKGKLADRVFRDFRAAEDPEAPVTVLGAKKFPYQVRPRKPAKGSVAVWDGDSLVEQKVVASGTGSGAPKAGARRGLLDGLLAFPPTASNALLVSAAESRSGHPLMVAGPQTGYFNPQILMEQDVHAPAAGGKPGIDARGASFIGVNLYVQLGRGRDYAWSATSAGQDNIDTFALELCDPGGGEATLESTGYRFRGDCEAIEVLERVNSWSPTPGDMTPAGTQTLRAERTKLGLVAGRALIGGKPAIYTHLRSTYFHEVDSAVGFLDFNAPERITDAAAYQRAAHRVGYTFNWFYADDKDIAYFNSGNNPVRARGVDPDLPAWGSFEWRDWDPEGFTARMTPFERHPQVVNQAYLTNWNNKQARAYRSAEQNAFSSTYRSVLLEDRIKAGIAGDRKFDLPGLVDAMEVAGTADLRAHAVLPLLLRVLGTPADARTAGAVAKLREWQAAGGLRKDADHDGAYDHAEAVALMDAWWPRLVRAIFEPRLGKDAVDTIEGVLEFDNEPNNHGDHLGSAYQGSWYGYVRKDLRTLLRRKVRGKYALRYCGKGKLAACRRALESSLAEAVEAAGDRAKLYPADGVCDAGDQWCHDAVRQRPVGGASQPLIHWINRPTYQQANEILGRAR